MFHFNLCRSSDLFAQNWKGKVICVENSQICYKSTQVVCEEMLQDIITPMSQLILILV